MTSSVLFHMFFGYRKAFQFIGPLKNDN